MKKKLFIVFFITGSSEWIGAFEVNLILNKLLNVKINYSNILNIILD